MNSEAGLPFDAMLDPLEISALPAFRDNYIWLLRRHDCAVVVDPGDAKPVSDYIDAHGLRLAAVLLTHHHADHIGGLPALLSRYSPTVFGPAAESITGVGVALRGGEAIALPGLECRCEVLAIPGHTRGHIAYFGIDGGVEGTLFCGDTVFGAGCGRLFEGTPAQMFDSLATIAALPDATRLYPAHEYTANNLGFAAIVEPDNRAIRERCAEVARLRAAGRPSLPSTLALEKATNPFFRAHLPPLRAAVREWTADASPLGVFTALRAWRDQY